MNKFSQNEILVLTPFRSPECDVSTYSKNLINALEDRSNTTFTVSVCALENGFKEKNYPPSVRYVLDCEQKSEYKQLAEKINADDTIRVVLIQHDFNLYGGEFSSYLLIMMRALKKPVIVTFHTVIESPEAKRLRIVKRIAKRSEMIIVDSDQTSELLQNAYTITENKLKIRSKEFEWNRSVFEYIILFQACASCEKSARRIDQLGDKYSYIPKYIQPPFLSSIASQL